MFPINHRARARSLSSTALAIALALGMAGGVAGLASPAMAKAKEAAPQMSAGFRAVAGPLQQAIADLAKKPGDAAAGAAVVAKIDAAYAAAQTPDDNLIAGQLAIQAGSALKNSAMQRKGIETALASGKLPAADTAKFQFFLGSIAFDMKDYPTAKTALMGAVAGGYTENDAEAVLAEAYFENKEFPAGLNTLMHAIDVKKAAGVLPAENWYRRGLGIAYKAKLLDQAQIFSSALVRDYPTSENWAGAIAVLREVGKFQAQETLDLMRLVERTHSFMETGDYIEYLQAADARRSPGEVLKILDEGMKAGKLSASDVFISDVKTQATARLAADKASLPALERDAQAANAPTATVVAAADALLSYDNAAGAESLYQTALTKPGVDMARVLTRLGIAQVDQGKYADAQATFAKVDGVRKPIATLWATYAAQKAKGG